LTSGEGKEPSDLYLKEEKCQAWCLVVRRKEGRSKQGERGKNKRGVGWREKVDVKRTNHLVSLRRGRACTSRPLA